MLAGRGDEIDDSAEDRRWTRLTASPSNVDVPRLQPAVSSSERCLVCDRG